MRLQKKVSTPILALSKTAAIIPETQNYKVMDSEQHVHSFLVIGHDITAIVRSTEQLKKMNTSLENSNRDLEQFAYVASHDLQEPLRKIQVFSSQLKSRTRSASQYLYCKKSFPMHYVSRRRSKEYCNTAC